MSGIITDICIPSTGGGNCSVKKGKLLLNFSLGDTGFCTSNHMWLTLFSLSWLSLSSARLYAMELSREVVTRWCSQRDDCWQWYGWLVGGVCKSTVDYRIMNCFWLLAKRALCDSDSLTFTACLYARTYTHRLIFMHKHIHISVS